jgi:hypothetical protein
MENTFRKFKASPLNKNYDSNDNEHSTVGTGNWEFHSGGGSSNSEEDRQTDDE